MLQKPYTVYPYSSNEYDQNRYLDQYGKPVEHDVDQWFQRGIRKIDKPKKEFCSGKTCCYIFSGILCGIIVLCAILIPALWSVFNRVTTTVITTTTTASSTVYQEYLWSFDNTLLDWTSTYLGVSINGATVSSTSLTGYGDSLSLSSSSSQSVLIASPFLSLTNQSWTFESWIYPLSLSSADNTIVGQCEATTPDKCLHLTIRNTKIYMGFYSDDLGGITSLTTSKWYHVAYVFNSVNQNQLIYLNGNLDNSRTSASPFLGKNGSLMIGTSFVNVGNNFFNGFIDQLDYVNRAKSASEILDDATLTFYYSFDGGSIYDQGSLRINGSRTGSTNVVTGRVVDALQLGSSGTSYFSLQGLVLLGVYSQSYSISIWIQPSVTSGSSLIHVSTASTGLGWCLEMLGFSSSGQLVAASWTGSSIYTVGPVPSVNVWTHVASTYSSTNGLRLYINGNLFNSTTSFSYSASGTSNYMFVGNPLSGTSCTGGTIVPGQYSGAIDEFRLYSRELTAANVYSLANP